MSLADPPAQSAPEAKLRRVAALLNPTAGSVGADAEARLASLCAEAGVALDLSICAPDTMSETLGALSHDVDAVLVLGGDGTARAVAEQLGPDGPPFAPLPGGTMNMLPRALYGDRAWPVIAADLLAGPVRTLPLAGARADDHMFFCAGIFGTPAMMARARKALRAGRFAEAIARLRRVAARAFGSRVRAEPAGAAPRRAAAIAMICPAISGADELEWAALDPRNGLEAARMALRALVGDWRRDPAAATVFANAGTVRARAALPAILDGETVLFRREARIRLDPRLARVIVPVSADARPS